MPKRAMDGGSVMDRDSLYAARRQDAGGAMSKEGRYATRRQEVGVAVPILGINSFRACLWQSKKSLMTIIDCLVRGNCDSTKCSVVFSNSSILFAA